LGFQEKELEGDGLVLSKSFAGGRRENPWNKISTTVQGSRGSATGQEKEVDSGSFREGKEIHRRKDEGGQTRESNEEKPDESRSMATAAKGEAGFCRAVLAEKGKKQETNYRKPLSRAKGRKNVQVLGLRP